MNRFSSRLIVRAVLLAFVLLHGAAAIAAPSDTSLQAQQLLSAGDYKAFAQWLDQHGEQLSEKQRTELLYTQIRLKQPAAAAALLDLGFDPHARRPDGVNAAMLAAYYGDAELVGRFLDAGADPLLRADNGYALFDYALESGQLQTMRLLIDRWLANSGELRGEQAQREAQSLKLARAIIGEDYERLAKLTESGGLNSYNRSNYAPLPLAVRLNRVPAVDLLLTKGAYASIGNDGNDEAIPLNQAARGGRMQIARELLQWQASPNKPNGRGYTAVMLAAMYGHTDMLQLLLDSGGLPLRANNAGDNAMVLALQSANPAIVSILLGTLEASDQRSLRSALVAKDAQVKVGSAEQLAAADSFGIPAGFYALISKQSAPLAGILEQGASPNQTIDVGAKLSLLQFAVMIDSAELVRALVAAGAEIGYRNARGDDALAIATRMSRTELVALLTDTDR